MSFGDTRCITISVDYSDELKISLAWNKQHFASTLVVSHPDDYRTIETAQDLGADLFLTRIFNDRRAAFNMYAALELGLDYMGRSGWIAVMGADILLPRNMPAWTKRTGCLYTPRRRMHRQIPQSVSEVPLERQWRQYKHQYPRDLTAGYCQIFHASDPVLGPAPWHRMDCTWGAGPDVDFQNKWREMSIVRPPFEVLHLGEQGKNWAGRVTPFADGSIPEGAAKAEASFKTLSRYRNDRGISGRTRYKEKETIRDEDVSIGAI